MAIYNLEVLKEMSGGDTDFIQQVLTMTLEDLPEVITKLEKANEQEDWDTVFQVAHKIKPTMQTVGLDSNIWTNLLTINDYAKNKKNLEELSGLVVEICGALKKLVVELNKELV